MIKLGVYGCGNRTKQLLNSLINDNFYEVAAAYDLVAEATEAFTAQYGGVVCKTPEEIMSNKDVDAFFVSLAPRAHAEVLRTLIPIGKPIFIEKPVAFTGKESKELADLAAKHNVMVQVGFMRRYMPAFVYLQDFVRNNDPGKVFNIDANWLAHGDVEVNYCQAFSPDNFRLHVSQIPFHCCHMLDNMCIFGGNVKSVTSKLIKVTERPYPSPDDLEAIIEFESGATGRFHFSSVSYKGEINYLFIMENYTVEVGGQYVVFYRRPPFRTSEIGPDKNDSSGYRKAFYAASGSEKMSFTRSWGDIANENIMYDFVKMVRDGVPPKASLEQSTRVQGLAEAIELSGQLGKTIYMDEYGVPILD